MKTKTFDVTVRVSVTVDDTKFTPEFIAEFDSYMFPCGDVDEHMKTLAEKAAVGIISDERFIEGYGEPKDMGIKFSFPDVVDCFEVSES